MIQRNQKTGFTLLEILLVVGAIAILAAIVIVAINPTKQLGQTKNAQRRADITTVLNAVYQYSIDNNGAIPGDISTTSRNICKTGIATTACADMDAVDLRVLTNNELYLTAIPQDPIGGMSTDTTGYFIKKTASNRINVTANFAEQGEVITATR